MKKLVILSMAIAMMAPMAVMAEPAGAAVLTTCKPPNGKLSITPGLGTTKKIQTVNINLPVLGCKGSGGVTGGTTAGKSVGTAKTNCATFFTDPKSTNITDTITWKPASKGKSTFKATTKLSSSGSALIAVISGKITSGTFKNKTVKTTVKVTLPKTCATATDKAPLKQIIITGTKSLTVG